VGDREAKTDSVSVRQRSGEDLGAMSFEEFEAQLVDDVAPYR